MKNAILAILAISMLTACAGLELTPPKKEELVWTTANLVGFHAIQKYEPYAVKAEDIARQIEGLQDSASIGDTLNPLLLELSLYLSQEDRLDPVIGHGLTLLLPMIHVKPGAVPEDKMRLIKSAAVGYIAGVNSGRIFARRNPEEAEKIALNWQRNE
jgi:hypothetical protein